MTEDNTADAKGNAKAQAAADKAYRKASRPWFKKKRFIFPLILVAIIMISALANGGKKDSAESLTPTPVGSTAAAAPASPAQEAAPAFPGAEKSDVVGQAGAGLKIGEVTVTSAQIANGETVFSRQTLCTAVTMNNTSKETISFNLFDWKLQTPGGTIVTTGFSGSDKMLSSGEIAPGGTASGDVCFDNKQPAPGTYVVLYEPVFKFFSDRAAWINAL